MPLRLAVALPILVTALFAMQGAIHKKYIHYTKFEPASDRCNAMNSDQSLASTGPRGKCIQEMLDAMDEGNDMLWFLR